MFIICHTGNNRICPAMEFEELKTAICFVHKTEFPTKEGYDHHIKEIHMGLHIDEIERLRRKLNVRDL